MTEPINDQIQFSSGLNNKYVHIIEHCYECGNTGQDIIHCGQRGGDEWSDFNIQPHGVHSMQGTDHSSV